MLIPAVNQARTKRAATTGLRNLVSVFVALVFALTLFPGRAHAQVIGDLEVTVPFPFYAGSAKLPAGKYTIHTVDNTDLTLMEISSADGSVSALFDIRDAEANPAPRKTELVFNKYGNRYFLAKLFDEGNPNGSAVSESRYEKKVSEAAAEAQAHIPAHHKGQQGG